MSSFHGYIFVQLIRFSGVALGEACTIVIRGATKQILDESDRSLHDALCVLQQTVKEKRVVFGGGDEIFSVLPSGIVGLYIFSEDYPLMCGVGLKSFDVA